MAIHKSMQALKISTYKFTKRTLIFMFILLKYLKIQVLTYYFVSMCMCMKCAF